MLFEDPNWLNAFASAGLFFFAAVQIMLVMLHRQKDASKERVRDFTDNCLSPILQHIDGQLAKIDAADIPFYPDKPPFAVHVPSNISLGQEQTELLREYSDHLIGSVDGYNALITEFRGYYSSKLAAIWPILDRHVSLHVAKKLQTGEISPRDLIRDFIALNIRDREYRRLNGDFQRYDEILRIGATAAVELNADLKEIGDKLQQIAGTAHQLRKRVFDERVKYTAKFGLKLVE